MRTGELSEPVQKRSVLSKLQMELTGQNGHYGTELSGSAPGETVFASVGPLPGYEQMPWRQVTAAANAFAAGNALCQGMLLSGILPVSLEEPDLKRLTGRFQQEAADRGTKFYDVRLQVLDSVSAPQFFVTAFGLSREKPALLRPGQDLIMTREIALAGTAALAGKYERELGSRFPPSFVERAKSFERFMPLAGDAKVLSGFRALPVHCLGQGGIFQALWEMAERAGVGLTVDLKKIPVRQESIELCEYFDINPYAFYSAGALLIAADQTDALLGAFAAADVPAAVIGKVIDSHDRVIMNGENRRFLDRPGQDEWWRITKNERTDFEST